MSSASFSDFGNIPSGQYNCIVVDPPWTYGDVLQGMRLGSDHYKGTMTNKQIAALPVGRIASPLAVCGLWTTGSHHHRTKKILKSWGFRETCVLFVWNKTYANGNTVLGAGHYTRPSCEFLVLGVRGKGIMKHRLSMRIRQLLNSQRREHSRKPDEAYKLIEELFSLNQRIELFARESRPGWDNWGNETDKFNAQTSTVTSI